VQFSRLSLANFKSFLDQADLIIEPGLTGVVGPNGCGKSNLVEALRWAMGETSAKQLRGGEMDDVIFAGTDNRPPRNLADVTIHLDNSDRTAPAQFNEFDALEISRRIERGHGSTYRVNGKEVRARDVQLIFADQATGARSTALVSQGQIGALIAAKPTARRTILEEAAGITGLHNRRHEAELRLRAAETNLTRLDDVLAALEAQLQTLKRQARQATRYRNLSDHIRRAEAAVLYLRWRAAQEDLSRARAELDLTAAAVAEHTGETSRLSAAQAQAAAHMPGLRQAEAEAAAALQRLTLARESLDAEEARLAEARAGLEARRAQIAADRAREDALSSDAAGALTRLAEEETALAAAAAEETETLAAAEAALAAAQSTTDAEEAEVSRLMESVAAAEARRTATERDIGALEARDARLRTELAEIEERQDAAADPATGDDAIAEAEAALAAARADTERLRAEETGTETRRGTAQAAEGEARDRLQEARAAVAELRAEESALAAVLAEDEGDLWPPLVDAVTVAPGHEAALGAALGDDLSASDVASAPVHWRDLPPLDARPLPDGAAPLADHVDGPPRLARRLSQIGVVADAETGRRLQDALHPGQRLVTREGALWRWDGFVMDAGAPAAAANRLRQRNRLTEIRAALPARAARETDAAAAFDAAQAEARAAMEAAGAARDAARQAAAHLDAARDRQAELAQARAAELSRRQALKDTAQRLAEERAEVETRLAEARAVLAELPETAESRQGLESRRAALQETRAALAEARSERDRLRREAEARAHRLRVIAEEQASWRKRADGARGHIDQLAARDAEIEAELARLARMPDEIAEKRQKLLAEIETAETARRDRADRLAEAETALAEVDRTLKAAEEKLASAREARARNEGLLAQAEQTTQAVAERAAERLDCKPDALGEIAEIAPDGPDPDPEAAERKLERLQRERANMGPVNLRADVEAEEQQEKIASLETEREDLLAAIAKLRGGIGTLNREGRQRLLAAFEKVDRHFQELFTRLFGGGRAHLTLTESDDPLEAGLEILAQPPGKKLQTLSLLSGGERALTALALLFAVFLTNPAPICVLDEVDAPLDDANVERFCALVDELAHSLATRFLVITHHRMTMARMDRLFGVTMAERGVSQLVSVDLRTAERLRATA